MSQQFINRIEYNFVAYICILSNVKIRYYIFMKIRKNYTEILLDKYTPSTFASCIYFSFGHKLHVHNISNPFKYIYLVYLIIALLSTSRKSCSFFRKYINKNDRRLT